MIINNKYIDQAIKYQLNKKQVEDLAEKDLCQVEELDLSNRTLGGIEKNIDLLEIFKLKNLKSLNLQYFQIDDSIIEILNSFKYLERIRFTCCEFKNQKILLNRPLKNINIEYCSNIKYNTLNSVKSMRIVSDSIVNLNDLLNKSEIEILSINGCHIVNFNKILDFIKLKILNLDGSHIDSKKTLKLLTNVDVSMKKEYLPLS